MEQAGGAEPEVATLWGVTEVAGEEAADAIGLGAEDGAG